MASYTFRCESHGDFPLEQPMASTTSKAPCPICNRNCSKVLGAAMQFTYGRRNFHDGPDGTGETVRETGERWSREYEAVNGRKPEPVGERWI